ncbi:MAG: VanZ family protein [Sedimentisphaeraceae bacterium JB056]
MILRITYFTTTAAILSTIILIVLTHIPENHISYYVKSHDKQLHYTAYLMVSFLYGISFSQRGWRGLLGLILVTLAMCALGAVDEYSQQYFDRRTDIKDYYADLWGIFTGVSIATSLWLVKTISNFRVKINISR